MSRGGSRGSGARWQYNAPLGARLCDLLCFGALPKVPSWQSSMVESPSSESLSSLSRRGAGDHEDEVVSMSSTQEGENFVVGDAIEALIEKLNNTPRSEDSTESIHALLHEAVAVGGDNLRENMALYFATKRGLEFGMQRDTIDEIIEGASAAAAAEAASSAVDQSTEVSAPEGAGGTLKEAGVSVVRMQSGVAAFKHADGTYADELPDIIPDVLDDLLTTTTSKGPILPSAAQPAAEATAAGGEGAPVARAGSGLLPPPGQLEPGLIAPAAPRAGSGGAGGKAAPAPPSTRAGSLQ